MAKRLRAAKHGDKLDKYRAHLLEKARLNESEQGMLEKYRKSWSLMGMGYSREQTVTVLQKEYGLSLSQSYALIREAIQLYGDVTETNKKGMRQIMYENFMLAASLARKAGDFGAMIRATENAAKLQDAFNTEQILQDPNDYLRPVQIVFSTASEVLKSNQLKRQIAIGDGSEGKDEAFDDYENE